MYYSVFGTIIDLKSRPWSKVVKEGGPSDGQTTSASVPTFLQSCIFGNFPFFIV